MLDTQFVSVAIHRLWVGSDDWMVMIWGSILHSLPTAAEQTSLDTAVTGTKLATWWIPHFIVTVWSFNRFHVLLNWLYVYISNCYNRTRSVARSNASLTNDGRCWHLVAAASSHYPTSELQSHRWSDSLGDKNGQKAVRYMYRPTSSSIMDSEKVSFFCCHRFTRSSTVAERLRDASLSVCI